MLAHGAESPPGGERAAGLEQVPEVRYEVQEAVRAPVASSGGALIELFHGARKGDVHALLALDFLKRLEAARLHVCHFTRTSS